MTPTPTTRASLLFRLRDSQDHEAWVEFVEIYEPAVYRQLRKCGLQDADARELMQELFVAVNRQIARWELAKERGSFRGWLRRVTRNLVINWRKAANGEWSLGAVLNRRRCSTSWLRTTVRCQRSSIANCAGRFFSERLNSCVRSKARRLSRRFGKRPSMGTRQPVSRKHWE
jgi:RNA polymerase sigma factor (sigma-70 family)